MSKTSEYKQFEEGVSPREIAEHVASILCDGHPDLHIPKKKREHESPPKRSVFARAVKWEDKVSLRKAIYFLEQEGMGESDIQTIRDAAERTMNDVLGTLINRISQQSEIETTITDKDMVFNDLYYMGARFMNREFTPDERNIIRKKLLTELKKEIYPRVVYAFGQSSAKEDLAKIRRDLAEHPADLSEDVKAEQAAIEAQEASKIPDGLS